MKKVMVIAYNYPPKMGSGILRTVEFEKHLPCFGWQPFIHTVMNGKRKDGNKRKNNIYRSFYIKINNFSKFLDSLIRVPLKMFKIKLPYQNIIHEFIIIPDDKIGWIPFCFFHGIILNKKNNYDLIYVSCKPYSAAITGVLLKKILGKKLIIDYRDHFGFNTVRRHTLFYKKITKILEKYLMKNCDRLITNTKGMEILYQKHYPDLKISTIHNGFAFIPEDTYKKNKKMIISHIGNFYLNRTPELLLMAIKSLQLKDIIFQDLGNNSRLINYLAKKYMLHDQIKILGYVPNDTALLIQQKSDVLFLSQNHNKRENIQIATKTFEYLATGRPILADVPEGDNAEIIKKYSKNSYVITDRNAKKIEAALLDLYCKWKKDELIIDKNPELLEKFNRKNLTRQLSEAFNEVLLQPIV